MHETSTSEDFMIAINGPNLSNADAVVKKAMNSYWQAKRSEWNLYRTIRIYMLNEYYETGSQTLDRLLKKQIRFPFMDI